MDQTKTYVLLSTILFFHWFQIHCQHPEWDWIVSAHSSKVEVAYDVVSDPNTGDAYMVGQWESNLDAFFITKGTPSTDFTASYGKFDGFVAKYDESGNYIWAFIIGGPEDDVISSISIDFNGNIYITGSIGTGINNFSGISSVTEDSTKHLKICNAY